MSLLANMKITSDQLQEMRKVFNKIDKDQSGTLSKEELHASMSEMNAFFNIDESEFGVMIESLDLDGDGQVDFREFFTAAIDKTLLLCDENLKSAFLMLDQDGNGVVDISELKEVFSENLTNRDATEFWQDIMD